MAKLPNWEESLRVATERFIADLLRSVEEEELSPAIRPDPGPVPVEEIPERLRKLIEIASRDTSMVGITITAFAPLFDMAAKEIDNLRSEVKARKGIRVAEREVLEAVMAEGAKLREQKQSLEQEVAALKANLMWERFYRSREAADRGCF